MRLLRIIRVLAALMSLSTVTGCFGVSYREHATLSRSQYATIENYSDREVAVEQVDGLLREVAEILNVTLAPDKPKIRIVVTPPSRIADLYRRATTVATYGAEAEALYFPRASLVMIPFFDRTILGHELAHYVTEHYLKSTPRRDWERIAHMVENKLPDTPRPLKPWITPASGATRPPGTVPAGHLMVER